MPVGAVARQPRYLQTKHDAGAAHADFRHQLAEAVAIHHRSSGLAQIAVDHRDLLRPPAQFDGPLPESVLTFGALRVLEHLPQRRLPHIEICVPLQMHSLHFIAEFDHGWMTTSLQTSSASPANSIVNSAGTTTAPAIDCNAGDLPSSSAPERCSAAQARIHEHIPSRKKQRQAKTPASSSQRLGSQLLVVRSQLLARHGS